MNRSTFRELRSRPGYGRLYAAALLGRLANEMLPVSVVLLVLARTGDATLAGFVVAAATLPSLVSGPLLGAWLDRSHRRIAMLAADQVLTVTALAGLCLAAGHAPDWTLPLIVMPAGVTYPLAAGGFTSLLPSVVGERLRLDANALEATNFHMAVVAGPALAGAIGAASPLAAVLTQLGLKAAALVCTLRLRDPRPAAAREGGSILATARAGIHQVLVAPPLLAVTVAGALSLGGRGLLVIGFPFWAADELGKGHSFAGWLWAAFAAGSIAGALGLVRFQRRSRPERMAIAGIAASGVVMLAWPLASAPASALLLVASAGFVYGPGFVAQFGVRQEWAPEELQAQVFMTAASMKPALFALGAAFGGALIADLGANGTLLVAAGVQFAAVALGLGLLAGRTAAAKQVRAQPS